MARGIFEQLDWLTKKVKQLCCIVENGGGGGECTCDLILKSKSQIDSLVSSNGLLPGRYYRISNVCPPLYGGTDIIIQAATTNTLVNDGEGFFYNPKYNVYSVWNNTVTLAIIPTNGNIFEKDETVVGDNGATGLFLTYGMILWTSGDWSAATTITGNNSGATGTITIISSPSYNVGNKVVWGGRVWTNINGNIGTSVNEYQLDPAEWNVIAYNTTDYNLVVDEIKYNYNTDIIYYRRDSEAENSNVVDADFNQTYFAIKDFQWGRSSVSGNIVTNSSCKNVNFRGAFFQNNTLLQDSLIDLIVSDTSSQISFNYLNNSYIDNCNLSQSSTINSNNLVSSGLTNNLLSNSGQVNLNDLSYSTIFENIIDFGFCRNNKLSQGSQISLNEIFSSSEIDINTISNGSNIANNTLYETAKIRYNTLDASASIYNNTENGQIVTNNRIEYNSLSQASIYENEDVLILYNTLNKASSIHDCTVLPGGAVLNISTNTLNESNIYEIISGGGTSIVGNNILNPGSAIYGVNMDNAGISYNTFSHSSFFINAMNNGSLFRENTLNSSVFFGTLDFNNAQFSNCRVSNSTLDGNGLVQLAGNIVNTIITDVTLNLNISAATYIYSPCSKTISAGVPFDCITPDSCLPVLSYIIVNCGTGGYSLNIVEYYN